MLHHCCQCLSLCPDRFIYLCASALIFLFQPAYFFHLSSFPTLHSETLSAYFSQCLQFLYFFPLPSPPSDCSLGLSRLIFCQPVRLCCWLVSLSCPSLPSVCPPASLHLALRLSSVFISFFFYFYPVVCAPAQGMTQSLWAPVHFHLPPPSRPTHHTHKHTHTRSSSPSDNVDHYPAIWIYWETVAAMTCKIGLSLKRHFGTSAQQTGTGFTKDNPVKGRAIRMWQRVFFFSIIKYLPVPNCLSSPVSFTATAQWQWGRSHKQTVRAKQCALGSRLLFNCDSKQMNDGNKQAASAGLIKKWNGSGINLQGAQDYRNKNAVM